MLNVTTVVLVVVSETNVRLRLIHTQDPKPNQIVIVLGGITRLKASNVFPALTLMPLFRSPEIVSFHHGEQEVLFHFRSKEGRYHTLENCLHKTGPQGDCFVQHLLIGCRDDWPGNTYHPDYKVRETEEPFGVH